jgi:acyl transferase domain-containing protein
VLAQYLADVVQKGLDNVLDNGGDISAQIGLTNQIVDLIQNTTQEADFAALGVDRRAVQLLALLRETDPRLATGKTAADIERPETSIAQSSLFTGAVHEPQMFISDKEKDYLHFYCAVRSILFKLTKGDAPDISQMNLISHLFAFSQPPCLTEIRCRKSQQKVGQIQSQQLGKILFHRPSS